MPLLNKIQINQTEYVPKHCNYYVEGDGVVRTKDGLNEMHTGEFDKTIWVCIIASSVESINDAQCQATVSLVLASMLTYKMESSAITSKDIPWAELLRRG